MAGSILLTFEREPCFWEATAIAGDRSSTVVARRGDKLVGLATRSVGAAFVNGAHRRIGYLSQLRIEGTRRATVARLAAGFHRLEADRRPDELDFDFTTILAENRAARRLLEAGLASLPCYRPVAELATFTFSCSDPFWRTVRSTVFETSTVQPHELGEIAELLDRTRSNLQLAPTWSRTELESTERSRGLTAERFIWAGKSGIQRGCAALWDQSEFKQVVVRGCSRNLERRRWLSNAVTPWTGAPKLPPAGSPLRLGYLSHVAVPAGDAEMLCALIDAARRAARRLGLDLLALGLDSRRPELAAVRRQFRCQETRSVVYLVSRRGMTVPDEAFDRDRFVHPEIALL